MLFVFSGDHDLKPWVVSVPEVTFTTRSEDDEFLILASDGLWDVLSNDDVVKLARYELRQRRKELKKDDTSSSPLCYVAEELLKIALDALSFDNISIIIVDLKFPERRCLPRAEKRLSLPPSPLPTHLVQKLNMSMLKITN